MKASEKLVLSEAFVRRLTEIRQQLHMYPELSFQEYKTCETVTACLTEWGIPYRRVGETGVVVEIVGERGEGLAIGLRADMDALPIQEQTGLPFSSRHPGVMHACGHDGHTVILLGTARELFQRRRDLRGRVRCIFQPGEEANGAAKRLISQGVLDNPRLDVMLALHLWPHLPFGTVGVRYGAMTASCDDFTIEIVGRGGHGARPHQGVDAIAVAVQVLQAISFLVTKENNPTEPVIVHVGQIQGGEASNIIADRVILRGTVRAVAVETRQKVKERLVELVAGVARSHGARASVSYTDGIPPVINDERLTQCVEKSAQELLGIDAVHLLQAPSMGADDFGDFADLVPSTYFRLGIRKADTPCYDLHHPQFSFDDAILPLGVKLLTWTVLSRLQKRSVEEL
ncbi:MAG: amidohydrolase [Brevibacillus sp.]|nr:amidohydrolase [Brevibacillus sp.]